MKRRVLAAGSLLVFSIFLCLPLHSLADTIVKGFKSKTTLQPGLIVSLTKGSNDTVELTPGSDASRIYGVVIDPSQAPVTVQKTGEQAFVATGGNYPVLVSTENGAISSGDYLSMSSINGIAARADSDQPVVIGRAVEGFDGKSGVIFSADGGIAVGRVTLSIVPGKNPLVKNENAIPAPLKRFGQAIAGKNVSSARIYASLIVFAVTAIIAISVLWVGIHSGIIAIGRNPLSKNSILQSLLQVVTTAILVFVIGIFGVYLLLRL